MADGQVRVILWSIPRTVSTAFVKSMSNLDDVQIINEPYLSAYLVGPERPPITKSLEKIMAKFVEKSNEVKLSYDYGCGWDAEKVSYKYVKENILEADYPGKKVVFVKDMAYGVSWKMDMLPKGYRHAFLIRNPVKVFASWKKMLNKIVEECSPPGTVFLMEKDNYMSDYYAFGESLQIYEHLVKTGIEPNPVIIDTDDLLENPELILRKFCNLTGIEYTDKILTWNAGYDVVEKWIASDFLIRGHEVIGYYKAAFESQKFTPGGPVPDRSTLTDDTNVCIDAAMPFYEQMYALRMRVGDT